ncbi:MAG: DUF1062 domain-containing protein [Butyrivibrio sp.]|nr:DUF1062 domain-containing protein [Butyrivibrio sp.]
MGYLNKIEYEIVTDGSFTVIRGCKGCGRKARFGSTEKFRVNANGNMLDVWLLYRCEECGHTLKLAVYERQRSDRIPADEYEGFMRNDAALAEKLGRSLALFGKNRAEVDFSRLRYRYVKLREASDESIGAGYRHIEIYNPHGLRLRPEKQLAEVTGLSVSRVKKLLEQEKVEIKAASAQFVSFCVSEGVL